MKRFALFRRRRADDVPGEDDVVEYEQPGDPSPESIYLAAAARSLDAQISAFDVLDTKTGQAFSVGSLTLPITFTLINLAPDRVDIPRESIWALWVALTAYILLIFFVFLSNRFNAVATGVNLEELKHYSDGRYPGILLQRWVADTYTDASTLNHDTLARKGRWVAWALFALWIEGVALAVAAILTLLFGL